MIETVTDYLVGLFTNTLPKEVIIFLISLCPILELRGGMIAAKLLGIGVWKAFVICYLGNIIPIPFILLFIRRILRAMKKYKATKGLAARIEKISEKKSDKIMKYKRFGLLFFVAIPLPGTGGWTGSLAAAFLDLRMRDSFPLIALGVFIADLIMAAVSYGLFGFILG